MAVETEKRKEEAVELETNQEQDLIVEVMEENSPVHSEAMEPEDWRFSKENAAEGNPRQSAVAEREIPRENPQKQRTAPKAEPKEPRNKLM